MEFNEPLAGKLEARAEELSGLLAQKVKMFALGEHHGKQEWFRTIKVLQEPLTDWIVGEYSDSLRARGIQPLGREQAAVIVRKALAGTGDLRKRLLEAPDKDEVVVAAFGLGTLIGRTHQLGIVKNLMRFVQGLFGIESVQGDEGFTGRRRWRTSVSSSRHGHLDFVVRDEGQNFFVAPGLSWYGPRQEVSGEFAIAQSSGCRCYLEFEYVDGFGNRVWR